MLAVYIAFKIKLLTHFKFDLLTASCMLCCLTIYGGPCSTFIYSSHQHTPLHNAARDGHVDIVRYLVEQDVDINIKDQNGVSEQEYTADCKLLLLVRVCFHSPKQRPLLLHPKMQNKGST